MKSAFRAFSVFVFAATISFAGNSLETNPQKDLILQTFQRFVDENSSVNDNHFFYLRRSDKVGWIYWREGRQLWSAVLDPYYEKKGAAELTAKAVFEMRILIRFKPTSLDDGVIPDGADIHGSSYVVHKSEIAEFVYDAVLDGELIEIHKGPGLIPGIPTWSIQAPGPRASN